MKTTRDTITVTINPDPQPSLPLNKDNKPHVLTVEGNHENRPVYLILMPILRYCIEDIQEGLKHGDDDIDAAEVNAAMCMCRDYLNGLDTTVRETF